MPHSFPPPRPSERTGPAGQSSGDLLPEQPTAPLPGSQLTSTWIIDGRRFHELDTPVGTPDFTFNLSRKIDPRLVAELHSLPNGGGDLAFRNLKRGVMLQLPSGQAVAEEIGVANPLTPDEVATGTDGAGAKEQGLHEETPTWYYILKEAQVRAAGQRLGTVG